MSMQRRQNAMISRPCRDVLDKQKAQNQGGDCSVLICGLGFLYTQCGEYMIILYTLTYIQLIGIKWKAYLHH